MGRGDLRLADRAIFQRCSMINHQDNTRRVVIAHTHAQLSSDFTAVLRKNSHNYNYAAVKGHEYD